MVCLHVGHVPPSPGPMPPAMAYPLCTLDTTTVLDTPVSMVDTDFPSSISRPRLLMLVLRRPCLQEEGRSVRLKPTLPFSTLTATEFTEPDMFQRLLPRRIWSWICWIPRTWIHRIPWSWIRWIPRSSPHLCQWIRRISLCLRTPWIRHQACGEGC